MTTNRPQWCGCKDRCAEEDTSYSKPNDRGSCQMYAPGNSQSPTALARKIYDDMSVEERKVVQEYGSGDSEDAIRGEAPGWSTSEIADCLNEIDKLCGYESNYE
jgi:hypothetical protein